ncbi:MAG: hypothetical protein KDB03_02470 [Planctomycetales bacterium]|nr:hypothetical protein [Planctomycetales bacterium]
MPDTKLLEQKLRAGPDRAGQNLGTQFERVNKAAGVIPWPKLFVNLRSTRRIELQEKFPSHVVDAWLGHSTKVAEKRYLQVTNDHWQSGPSSATSLFRLLTGPLVSNISGPITIQQRNQETNVLLGSDGSCWPMMDSLIPPTGLRQRKKNKGFLNDGQILPQKIPLRLPSQRIASPKPLNRWKYNS